MRSFYTYWEHEIFTALVELVLRNLCQFFANIFGSSSLFFSVDVLLTPPRIKLQPSLEELVNSIRRSAQAISELPKYFTRWLHGTCLPCPATPTLNEGFEPPDLTFYNDVKQHPDVVSRSSVRLVEKSLVEDQHVESGSIVCFWLGHSNQPRSGSTAHLQRAVEKRQAEIHSAIRPEISSADRLR